MAGSSSVQPSPALNFCSGALKLINKSRKRIDHSRLERIDHMLCHSLPALPLMMVCCPCHSSAGRPQANTNLAVFSNTTLSMIASLSGASTPGNCMQSSSSNSSCSRTVMGLCCRSQHARNSLYLLVTRTHNAYKKFACTQVNIHARSGKVFVVVGRDDAEHCWFKSNMPAAFAPHANFLVVYLCRRPSCKQSSQLKHFHSSGQLSAVSAAQRLGRQVLLPN